MSDPKGGVAKVTCPTFETMGQIPVFHRTYFLLIVFLSTHVQSSSLLLLDEINSLNDTHYIVIISSVSSAIVNLLLHW